ncbi:MAG: hypothetical protein Kow0042_07030 [Calditrichia bacterium]
MEFSWTELLGYAATVLIAISMWMHSIVRLRWFAFIGAVLFSIYGIFIHSVPVIILNLVTAGAHGYHLFQLKTHKEYFEIMTVPSVDTPFLKRFVNFYRKDLAYFFPEFSLEKLQHPHIFFVFRDMVPAALFIAEPFDKKTLNIIVDYVTPGYRDLKSARYIFVKGKKLFRSKGYERFITRAFVKEHEKYLKKMGFKKITLDNQLYYEKPI